MLIMKSFFENMPEELEEAAAIDGLNTYGILLRIILPLSKAVMATMVLFYAVGHWNSWFPAFLYLDKKELFPVTIYLRNMIAGATGGASAAQEMPRWLFRKPIRVKNLLLYPRVRFYHDEGQEFAKWGVEGETFTKQDGVRKLADDVNYNGLNPKGTKDLRIDYGFSGGVFAYGGTTDLLHSMFSEEELKFQQDMKDIKEVVPAEPPVPYSDIDREQVTLLSTPLKDFSDQNTLKFILGERNLSEFDAFVKELESQGLPQYMQLANDTYKKYKENKQQ
ncbi:hypothetical protein G195_000019 [Phytophthora kernoviae 00238/432]|uniref:ABC transmembrane type-1 domain-containing protein n=1 Tax=Phytophthora kernoviae 00238/432 TaxID=1284355 RepID=A0A8J4SE78_9STRA|nr:hypothetical protein G195_000019 [Phytophthora kernoviae 00238/432]